MVVFGQTCCIGKNSGKSRCIRAKWLNLGKRGGIRAEWLYLGKNVVGQSGCIRAKVLEFD